MNYLTNSNVLLVVKAYMDEYERTSMDDKMKLVNLVLSSMKPKQIAEATGINVAKIYQYKRTDFSDRQHDFPMKDFIRLAILADSLAL